MQCVKKNFINEKLNGKLVNANIWIHAVTRQEPDIENLWKQCAYSKPIFTNNIIEILTHKWTHKRKPIGKNAEKAVTILYWEQGKEKVNYTWLEKKVDCLNSQNILCFTKENIQKMQRDGNSIYYMQNEYTVYINIVTFSVHVKLTKWPYKH